MHSASICISINVISQILECIKLLWRKSFVPCYVQQRNRQDKLLSRGFCIGDLHSPWWIILWQYWPLHWSWRWYLVFLLIPFQFIKITWNSSPVLWCTLCPFQQSIVCKFNNHQCYAIIQLLMKILNKPAPRRGPVWTPAQSICPFWQWTADSHSPGTLQTGFSPILQ